MLLNRNKNRRGEIRNLLVCQLFKWRALGDDFKTLWTSQTVADFPHFGISAEL